MRRGEVAVGRGLRELHAGLNAGRLLDPLVPGAYLDLHAGYVLSERALGVSTNKAIADLAAGYFFMPRFSTRLVFNHQKTFGGLDCGPCIDPSLPANLREGHDRLLKDDHTRAGVAVDFAATPAVGLYAAYMTTLRGRNTHYGYGVTLGVARSFRP